MAAHANVREDALAFKDGSKYRGQVMGEGTATEPHGFGRLETKDGFVMTGYFKAGKTYGPGEFRAPNGDLFYGTWNDEHKRHGRGLSVRASDQRQTVETYENGKLGTKVVRRAPPHSVIQWLGPPGWPAGMTGTPPSARSGHSATLLGGGAMWLIFGGLTQVDGRMVAMNDVHLLDVESKAWMQPEMKGTPPPPMSGHAAVAVGSQLYIIGGQNGMEVSSNVYVLDTTTGTWSCPLTKGINFAGHSATLVGHTIWVLVESSVFTLDTRAKTLAWKQEDIDIRGLKRSPRSFIAHCAVGVGPMIVVLGGKVIGGVQSGSGKKFERCTADVRILHTDRLAWEVPEVRFESDGEAKDDGKADYSGVLLGSYSTPRAEFTATLVGSKIYVFGGWASRNPDMNAVDVSYLSDVCILDMERMVWTAPLLRTVFTAPRGGHTATLINDSIWIFGGRNFASDAMSDFIALTTGEDERAYLRRQAAAAKKAPASAAAGGDGAKAADAPAAPPSAAAATPPATLAKTVAAPSRDGGGAAPPTAAPAKAPAAPAASAAASSGKKAARKTWDKPKAAT